MSLPLKWTKFSRRIPLEQRFANHPQGKYAFHSDELEYVFGTLDVRQGAVWHPEDRALSAQMVTYWTNFARTGNPNGAGLPQWPRFDEEKMVLHLDSTTAAQPDTSTPGFNFLEQEQKLPR